MEAVRALPVRPCKTRVLASDGSTNAALEVSRARAFQALRHRDFRLLFTGQASSVVVDAAFLTALGWKTFTLAGAGKMRLVLSVQGAGLRTTLLIGGALADRYERRRMMILSDVWRFAAVGTLAGLDATGHLGVPSLVVLAGIAGLGDGLFYPALGGIIPLVVDPLHLPSANALMGVARWGGFVVGPALAGFLYHGAGSSWVFAIDALSFLVSGVLMLLARPRAIDVEPSVGTLTEIREGASYVARIPWLWVTITLFAVILMLQLAPQQVLLPKLVKDHFDRGVGAYAALSAMVGVGTRSEERRVGKEGRSRWSP